MIRPLTAALRLATPIAVAGGLIAAAPAQAGRAATDIVQLRSGVSLGEGGAIVRAAHGRVTGRLPIIHGLAVRLSRSARYTLARDYRIAAVSANGRIRPQDADLLDAEPAPASAGAPTGGTDVSSDADLVPARKAPPPDPALPGVPDTASGATDAASATADAIATADPAATPDAGAAAAPAPAFATPMLATAYPYSVYAPSVWASGATGKGIGVAVIDTGVDGGLPDFTATDGSSRIIASVVTNPDARTQADGYGHGTHVAGIVAGDGNRRGGEAAGKYVGIAPEANIIAIKAADDEGHGTVLDAIYGLQFAVDHKADYNIRVVNLSVSSTAPESYLTDPLDAAVESAYFHGILVVAAVGNRGSVEDATQYAPGNDPFALSVGAVDDQGTEDRSDDVFADWSSVGTTQDGFEKPDLGAPGAHIVSTLARNSAFGQLCPDCVVDDNYIRVGGSSMAAPVVAGVAALLFQAHPHWTPADAKSTLIETARNVPGQVDEVNSIAALQTETPPPDVDAGIRPNELIDEAAGDIDYSRSSWGRSSWGAAPGTLSAGWARSSWGCTCTSADSGAIDQTRSSWGSVTMQPEGSK